jgi:hypothetical protein
MDFTNHLKNLMKAALMSGAVAVASLGMSSGVADAKPFYWCPGDPPVMGNAPAANGGMKPPF